MLYEEAVTFLLSFHQNCAITTVFCEKNQKIGPGEIWTPVAGFRVLSANRYTTGPLKGEARRTLAIRTKIEETRIYWAV